MALSEFCPLSKLEKLLLATDRSVFSEGAVEEAINFAKYCSSKLYVLSVLESNPEYETIGADFFKKEEEEILHHLESIKNRMQQQGIRVETILREADDPAQIIVDEAVEKAADMIIMGRRGRTGVLKVLMGKVAAKVIGNSPCKVLIVPKAARIGYKNILIATDGSLNSISAASEAIGIAKRRGCKIIALSASSSGLDLAEASANVNKVVEMAHSEGLEVAVLTPIGKPHEAILETASGRGVDLIVMGRYGKTGLKKLFMGSATEKVIGLSGCAILVV